ncbi:MAG: hypothetical protein GY799_10860 [Desulfobulbaceae bacterium]|nr:hypothetical protein [Desulfobulbaceae bacterium]
MKISQNIARAVADVNKALLAPRAAKWKVRPDGSKLELTQPTLLVPIHLDALVVDEFFHQNDKRADTRFKKIDPFHPDYKGKCEFFNKGLQKCSLAGHLNQTCRGYLADCVMRGKVVKNQPFEEAVGTSAEFKAPELFENSYLTLKDGVHLHWSMPDALTKGYMIGKDEESEVVFPDLPNRWLVVRTVPDDCWRRKTTLPEFKHKKQRGEAWVIIADGGQQGTAADGKTVVWNRVVSLSDYNESKCRQRQLKELTAVSSGDPSAIVFYDSCYDTFGFHDSTENMKDILHGPVSYQVFGWFAGNAESPLADVTSEEELKRVLQGYNWKIGLDLGKESELLTETEQNLDIAANPPTDRLWERGCELLCHASVHDVNLKQSGAGAGARERRPNGEDLFIGIGSSQEGAMGGWLSYSLGNNAGYGRLLAGFMDGHLADVAKMSQMNSFNHLLHKRGFASLDGGYRMVRVPHTTFDPLDREQKRVWRDWGKIKEKHQRDKARIGREAKPLPFEQLVAENRRHTEQASQKRQYVPESEEIDSINFAQDISIIQDKATIISSKRPQYMRKAKPRFYQPKDPILVIGGANRGIKHGEDGRFDSGGNLLCRLGEDCINEVTVKYYEGPSQFAFIEGDILHGGGLHYNPPPEAETVSLSIDADDLLDFSFLEMKFLPYKIEALVGENVIFDLASVSRFSELVAEAQAESNGPAPGANEMAYLKTCYRDQVCYKPQQMADAGFASLVDRRDEALQKNQQDILSQLIATFTADGRLPSPHGLRSWEQPWTPIHLDWHVSLTPAEDDAAAWELNGAMFQPREGEFPVDESRSITLQGRSILTPGAAKSMHRALAAALLKEKTDDYIADDIQSSLAQLTEKMAMVNVIGCSLGGFHDLLLGKVEEYLVGNDGASSKDVQAWLREGRLSVHRLRIVDSFGRYLDSRELDGAPEENIVGTDGVFAHAEYKNSLLIPPRINAPARLTFRFLDGAQAGLIEADEASGTSGICGWCMPDHLDGALEFFDATGHNLGQLREEKYLDSSHSSVIWEGVPGENGSYGDPPDSALVNSHLMKMVNGIRSWNDFDQTDEADESSLSALIRSIDANGWGVDPLGRTGSDHLAVLLGKPLAVVRAKLLFEIKEDSSLVKNEKYDEFCRIPFPVLIGNVREQTDGVMGFFINDDYHHFHLPDPELKKTAFAGGVQGATKSKEITHPYLFDDHALYVRVGQTVVLTILVDPRGGIHASSGILPQKRLDLIQEEIKPALDTMSVTFMVGPVLVDPTEVRMPHPREIKGNWNWLHRSSPVMWQEQPITPANDRARFAQKAIEAHEGWLKFSGGVGDSEEKK